MLGNEYVARDTPRNRINGIDAGAICLVRFVDKAAISIEVREKNRNSYPKLVIPIDIFGLHFEPRKNGNPYRGAGLSGHFTKRYT